MTFMRVPRPGSRLLDVPSANPLLLCHGGLYVGGEIGMEWTAAEVLYPATSTSFGLEVPPAIASSYAEAQRSFAQAGAYTGTAILCRRTLEGICSHFKAKGRNLADKLKSLKDKGIIDAMVYQWADDVLRALGNDAAHDVEQVIGQQDAKDALDFTRAIIEYIFVLQAAFERFKRGREERKQRKELSEVEGDVG